MSKTASSKKLTAVLLILVFGLPVLLAKLALDNDWFNRGSTNRGELLQPVVDMSVVLEQQAPKWRLLYTLPANCDMRCENAIYSMHQVWIALGKESDRAEAIVLITENSDRTAAQNLKAEASIQTLEVGKENVNKMFNSVSGNGIFLVDTLNNAMLRYPVFSERQDAVMSSRDMLSDVRKLLKLSRIG